MSGKPPRRSSDRGGRRARRGLASALVACSVALLAACSPGDADAMSVDVDAYLPVQNVARWTMPLDRYMVTKVQGQKESYALVLLTQRCLDEQGFVNDVPARTFVDDPDDLGIRDLFTPEFVSVSGYHSAGVLDDPDPAWAAYVGRAVSDAELAATDACVTGLLDEGFERYDNQLLNFASGLGQSAYAGSLEDPAVIATAAAWRECMAPKGVEDLPADPSEMPSESLRTRFGLSATPDAGQAITVSADEIELAVFDANCRQSSGYENARYDAEWSRQITLLAQNLDALESVKAEIAAVDTSISDIIAAHAPAA